MDIDKSIKIDDIVGLDEAKEILTTRLQAFFKFRNQLKGGSRGILLYGYPGTAKTMLTIAVLNTLDESKVLYKIVTTHELTEHVGTTSEKVRGFFESLQREAGQRSIVLVLDEADETLTVKGDKSVIANERVSAILRELDGIENKNQNIYFIATTNHPMKIEPAMLRSGRIDCHIKTELPTDEERILIIKKYMAGIPGTEAQIDNIWKYTPQWTVKEGVIIQKGINGEPEVVILGFIPSDQRKFSYNFVFGLVLSIMKIAEKHGGRPYATGMYFSKKADSVLVEPSPRLKANVIKLVKKAVSVVCFQNSFVHLICNLPFPKNYL